MEKNMVPGDIYDMDGGQKEDILTYGFLYCLWHSVHGNLNFHNFIAVPKYRPWLCVLSNN